MQSSERPTLLPYPFAFSGDKNTISESAASPQASLEEGFPPITMTPKEIGGVPPDGRDFNGLFYWLSSLLWWQNAGGLFPYNSALSTKLGGYPKGAVLQSDDGSSLYVSLIENNTYDPNVPGNIGTRWAPWSGAVAGNGNYADDTGIVNALVVAQNPPITVYGNGERAAFKAKYSNTSTCTIDAGGGVVSLLKNNGAALEAGDIVAGTIYEAIYDATSGAFLLAAIATSSTWKVGDLRWSIQSSAVAGWVSANGLTIGSASSGATGRANLDTSSLFTLLWTNCANDACPVQDSTGAYVSRGASASADWAANRRIALPNVVGRSIVGAGSGSFATVFTAEATYDTATLSRAYSGLATGQAVVLSTTGTLPAGLTPGTYYAIRTSDSVISFATTVANALAGTAVNITDTGSGVHTLTISLTARLAGQLGGEETHATSGAEVGPHVHTMNITPTPEEFPYANNRLSRAKDGGATTSFTKDTELNSGGAGHNNMSPFMGAYCYIKL